MGLYQAIDGLVEVRDSGVQLLTASFPQGLVLKALASFFNFSLSPRHKLGGELVFELGLSRHCATLSPGRYPFNPGQNRNRNSALKRALVQFDLGLWSLAPDDRTTRRARQHGTHWWARDGARRRPIIVAGEVRIIIDALPF